jgi:hypothetical protein
MRKRTHERSALMKGGTWSFNRGSLKLVAKLEMLRRKGQMSGKIQDM